MNRYICIHGHFYQPPRENPWLEEVEEQDSAYPHHDWNARITAECYGPNTASRILNAENRIVQIVNNYAKINFNFGPTLLSWMQKHAPNFYHSILDADKESQKQFSGHGAAIAQAYNHMIMPLANEKDKRTQVIWGIKDFEFRFKRKPEGMWLPETGVDIPTLEILAEEGIKYTILAPHQVQRIRKMGEEQWRDVHHGHVNGQRAYVCRLPSGKDINLFIYDGPLSQEISFSDLLKSGEKFASKLMKHFPEEHEEERLVHIATDGETYGHHYRFGDMALAYCLHHVESKNLAKITIYGEYLEKFPPAYEAEINENTSWSCAHGVERWKADCGCGGEADSKSNQKWRAPLREALDWLRDTISPLYENEMKVFAEDPWHIRNQYIDVVLSKRDKNVEKFLSTHIRSTVTKDDRVKVIKLLEMQRHAMLMYTSCGWFFEDVARIETTQIIQYAARVIQLAQQLFGLELEKKFISKIKKAHGCHAKLKNAAIIYNQQVKPTMLDFSRVGAHYAAASLFDEYPQETQIYCYSVKSEVFDRQKSGKQRLLIGKTRIRSEVTLEEEIVSFAVVHLGDHNLNGGVCTDMDDKTFKVMQNEIKDAFFKNDISEVLRFIDQHFGTHNYSLWHLFRHEQKKIFDLLLEPVLQRVEQNDRRIYEEYYPYLLARRDLHISLPKAVENILQNAMHKNLLQCMDGKEINCDNLLHMVEEIELWGFSLDKRKLGFSVTQKCNLFMRDFLRDPHDVVFLISLETFLRIIKPLALDLDLWKVQNGYFGIGHHFYKKKLQLADGGNKSAKEWVEVFERLGEFLGVKGY